MTGPTATNEQPTGSYAPVNGLQTYYEIYGSGSPLVLIHGSFGMIGMYARLLPALAEGRRVIAIELQGHGHTADIDRPFSFEQLADDIATLITHLGLKQADVAGYSLGGGVALQAAIRHPNLVRKLVIISAPAGHAGWYPEVQMGLASLSAEMLSGSPIHEAYLNTAPRPEDWPSLVTSMRQLLTSAYDWTKNLPAIMAPTLIVVGDHDGVRLAYAAEMFEKLGGKTDIMGNVLSPSQLAVLPGTTHLSILSRTDLLLPILAPFLDASLQQDS